jgi:hypothetical protein
MGAGNMAQAVHASGRGRELIDQLRADHLGEIWDDKRIVDIRLLSSPDEWPPTIQLDYMIGDQAGRWVDTWDGEVFELPLDAASGLWQALVSVRLLDATEPLPEHRTL